MSMAVNHLNEENTMKRNISYILLICISVISVFTSGGCKIDDGAFVPNGNLYDGVVVSPITGNVEDFENSENLVTEEIKPTPTKTPAVVDRSDAISVTMTIKDYGIIKLNLYPKVAPITVENFVELASNGFYDGLTFHRVINDFMIQGGDPTASGTGGSDKKIKGEFLFNGVENALSHKRGVISMARYEDDFDSATSQFFICQQNRSDTLDNFYAAFGEVTEGMDVVDKIAAVETDKEDKPLTNVVIESVKIEK